jgi:cyclohexanone monooxygenase
MCKRPCFHNDYLPCFNLSNVTLIDTAGKGVDRISETGIVANDQEYDLDCIIYATGFDFGTDYSSRARYTVTGRNSLTLAEKWKDGPNTLYGLSTRDFPNYFIVSHIQSTTTPNYTRNLMERAKHITYLIGEVKKRGARTVEPTEEAEKGWVKTIEELAIAQGGFFRECTPGMSIHSSNLVF